jgi:alpha-tubulin suppressor-like RCC1 family protein
MIHRSVFHLGSPRGSALALSAVASFSLTLAVAGAARADATVAGAGPHAAIAAGTSHSCALFYDGTIRCWGSNALEQLGAGMNTGLPSVTTEDQPPPVMPVLGSCTADTDCGGGYGRCNNSSHQCECAWTCPSGDTCGTNNLCGQCAADSDCASGHCDTAYRVCASNSSYTCTTDAQCGTGKCATLWGICVQCLADADCGSSGYCSGYQCVCNETWSCAAYSACTSSVGGTPGTCAPITTTVSECPWGYTPGTGGGCVPVAPSSASMSIPEVPTAAGSPAPLLSNVLAVTGGDAHSCALVSGGVVYCWGENSSGQLGTGDYNTRSVPTQVSGIGGESTPAIAIAAGASHSCAVLADGTAKCWGDDHQSQLGAGGSAPVRSNTPIQVQGIGTSGGTVGATAIAAGADHTCALLADGSIQCWGGNSNGQIGDGTTTTRSAPVAVPGLGGSNGYTATAIAAGRLHTCALLTSAASTRSGATTMVTCWGYNGQGQLGDIDLGTTDSASPVRVSGLSGVRGISANGDHTCALLANGTVDCWGDNGDGQTGNGSPGNALTNAPVAANLATIGPTAVSGLSGVRSLSSGYFHNCAVLDNGTAKCWGGDAHGQLGDNAVTIAGGGAPSTVANFGSAAPNLVANAPEMVSGYMHTCVLGADGSANCWGHNAYDQLGHGAGSWTDVPAAATMLPVCTGSPSVCRGAISVCGGYFHGCGLLSDGTVWCWGDDSYGQLGNGAPTAATYATPQQVELGTTAVQIACGAFFTCAVMSDGTIQCWGDNTYGEMGNGEASTVDAVPQTVQTAAGVPLTDVTSIAVGGTSYHACALQGGTSIYCWGYAFAAAVGPNYTPSTYPNQTYAVPVGSLAGGKVAKSLAIGALQSCAVAADGTGQCWGYDYRGDLGDNNSNPSVYWAFATPQVVYQLTNATAMAAGYETGCALRADSTVECWGDDADYGGGAVGNGATTGNVMAPTPVLTSSTTGLSGAVAVSGGFFTNCALGADGNAHCWGFAGWGEVGNGSVGTSPAYSFPYAQTDDSSTPVSK